mgnify:CR=1 FL=1
MATYAMPTTIYPSRARFGLVTNTRSFVSPLSGAIQTTAMSGARWTATYHYPPMTHAQSGEFLAFLISLQGSENRFYAWDPLHKIKGNRGALGGTPLVDGASASGSTIATDGWPNNTLVLKKGDYFTVNNELKMVTADETSDGSGDLTINFEPPLRSSPSNNAGLTVSGATCIMMLVDDNQTIWDQSNIENYGLTFTGIEAFTS